MRAALLIVAIVSGCVPSRVIRIAGDRLGVRGKRLHLVDSDRIEGADVYTFCRNDRGHDVGNLIPIRAPSFDGACITLVCPAGDDGRHCD
jgi:hypothetical protein